VGKILITGTGRSGSSFLVHLLSGLGMDTGFTEDECADKLKNECRGGCEWVIDAPYKVLKNPNFAIEIYSIVKNHDIDHVIIPIRDLHKTAQSRAKNNNNHGQYGGFWLGSKNTEEQEATHAKLIYHLIDILTENNIPFTTVSFPKMIYDGRYLKAKMLEVFKDVSSTVKIIDNWNKVFNRVANPDKVTV
jgi:hypothetical protein